MLERPNRLGAVAPAAILGGTAGCAAAWGLGSTRTLLAMWGGAALGVIMLALVLALR